MERRDATTAQNPLGERGDRRRPRRHRRRRLRRGTTVAAVLTLALTSCYLLDPDLLPEGTDEVSIEVGETAQVDLGEWSPSIGDRWGAVPLQEGDAAEYAAVDDGVVTAHVVQGAEVFGVRARRDGPEAGGTTPHAIELTGVAPGTSTVRIVHCYRVDIAEDCDQGPRDIDPIELTVTVT
ncbi:hypothetical protein [Brachybacterium tyrofermentans]|uniref:Uncharacterized protein n=1 Tax=Brachybacterium tyrofermentans TaxID=47848 RepID=A0ABW0FG35_9MICO